MRTRDAILPDAQEIHDLISAHFETGTLLPRSFAEICQNIRDFVVAEEKGQIVGCGALHLYGQHLAEIRSIMVDAAHQGKGAGFLLVKALLKQAEKHHVSCVCLFTRIPEFFRPLGFSLANRDDIPDKLYKDCCVCPKLHCCDEVAMVRGQLPAFAILQPLVSELIKIEA